MQLVNKNSPSTKEDLLTAIWESWNDFNKEYHFQLMNSLNEKIEAVKYIKYINVVNVPNFKEFPTALSNWFNFEFWKLGKTKQTQKYSNNYSFIFYKTNITI